MCSDNTEKRLKPEVVCSHNYTIYEAKDWMVVKYTDEDTGAVFTACGTKLPTSKNTVIHLHGSWRENPKYGRQFNVDYFDVELPSSQDGVIAYLGSLRVGLGKRKSQKIYERFGNRVWSILETDPDQLLQISGVSRQILSRLKRKLEETKIQRRIIEVCGDAANVLTSLLLNRIVEYGNRMDWDILDVVENDTYKPMEVRGIGFEIADTLARHMPGFQADSPVRVVASLSCLFSEAESQGHTCLPKDELIKRMLKLLDRGLGAVISEQTCRDALNTAFKDGLIHVTSGMVYSKSSYEQETSIVKNLKRLMNFSGGQITEVDELISEYETENHIELASSQKDAVRSTFLHPVNIITGGPGVGKTTTIKAVLYLHEQVFGANSTPMLLAPTGRAARRMSEATGYPATTIHSAVGYTGVPELDERVSDHLEGNLFIIDESSMADQYITSVLLEMIPNGARVIFVGDPDQLPSVGAGNVLKEMIRSEVIPTVKLTVIFRQAQNNPIVENSIRIQQGNSDLMFDGHRFVLYEMNDPIAIMKKACSLYVKSVQKFGADNVILLNPYRSKSALNVNWFNLNIQHILNPAQEGELTIRLHGIEFCRGDKVMQTKNTEIAMNGDIGYIKSIEQIPDPDDPSEWAYVANIEFNGDGVIHAYTQEMMQDLDLAYCNTVHKSQGSEYQTVIIVAANAHERMLRRAVFYTAITRSRQNVAIVGEESALKKAIANNESDIRYTLLGDRLHCAFR